MKKEKILYTIIAILFITVLFTTNILKYGTFNDVAYIGIDYGFTNVQKQIKD